MLKKLIYLILLGGIGYLIFMPVAADMHKEEFEEAGATNASVFDFLKPNYDQENQDN